MQVERKNTKNWQYHLNLVYHIFHDIFPEMSANFPPIHSLKRRDFSKEEESEVENLLFPPLFFALKLAFKRRRKGGKCGHFSFPLPLLQTRPLPPPPPPPPFATRNRLSNSPSPPLSAAAAATEPKRKLPWYYPPCVPPTTAAYHFGESLLRCRRRHRCRGSTAVVVVH